MNAIKSSVLKSPEHLVPKMVQMKPNIMFVDDELNVIESYRRLLRPYAEKWDVSFRTDSRQAYADIQRCPPDVLVTDVEMPYMSGLQLLNKMKAERATDFIPVIIVTGQNDRVVKRRALDEGAADLMSKPVQFEELVARLHGSLRLKSCYDELNSRNDQLEQRVLERTQELNQSRLEIVARLANAAEFRDRNTGRHIIRVAHYCRLIAQSLSLPAKEVDAIFVAAPLHDVGKIGIPDSILLKPGILTEDERLIMQTHCEIGGRMLGADFNKQFDARIPANLDDTVTTNVISDPVLKMAQVIAVTHHERWDGKGYPAGLAGEEIPLVGRIVALADVFDALTTARSYKPAFTLEHSLKLIREGVNSQFDPRVHSGFLSALPEIEKLRSKLADASFAKTSAVLPPRKEAMALARDC